MLLPLGLDLALLGTWVFLSSNSLTRTLTSAGVGVSALSTHRETTAMTGGAIAIDAEQALHVHLLLTAEVAFDHDLQCLRRLGDLGKLVIREFTRADVRIDIGVGQDFAAQGKTDAENIGQRVFDLLFVRDFDSK